MIELLVEGDHERTRYALPTTQNTLGKGGRVQQTHEKCRAELLEEQSKGKRTPAANFRGRIVLLLVIILPARARRVRGGALRAPAE